MENNSCIYEDEKDSEECVQCGSDEIMKQGCHGYCYDCGNQWGCSD